MRPVLFRGECDISLSGVDSLHVFVLILFLPTNVFHFHSQLRIRHKLSEALESTAGLPPTFSIRALLTERDDARKMPRVSVAFWFFCPHYLKYIYVITGSPNAAVKTKT